MSLRGDGRHPHGQCGSQGGGRQQAANSCSERQQKRCKTPLSPSEGAMTPRIRASVTSWQVFIALAVTVVIAAGLSASSPIGSGNSSGAGTSGFCDFSSDVVIAATQIQNLPKFKSLEGGQNYTLVSADEQGAETAYFDGVIQPDGSVSWSKTVYYPASWSLWYMPLPTYCAMGGSWVGVSFITAEVSLNADGSFNVSSASIYQGVFLPNSTLPSSHT